MTATGVVGRTYTSGDAADVAVLPTIDFEFSAYPVQYPVRRLGFDRRNTQLRTLERQSQGQLTLWARPARTVAATSTDHA